MDRYDPRDVGDRADSWDRNFGSRGGTSERDRNDERDPRDIFTRDLDLPRGRERRPAGDRDRVYEIDGAESRALATIGAFRVIAESDLHDIRDDSQSSASLGCEWSRRERSPRVLQILAKTVRNPPRTQTTPKRRPRRASHCFLS